LKKFRDSEAIQEYNSILYSYVALSIKGPQLGLPDAGPPPGFSSRGEKTGGAKIQKGGHIFKIQYWLYVATGGPNVK